MFILLNITQCVHLQQENEELRQDYVLLQAKMNNVQRKHDQLKFDHDKLAAESERNIEKCRQVLFTQGPSFYGLIMSDYDIIYSYTFPWIAANLSRSLSLFIFQNIYAYFAIYFRVCLILRFCVATYFK